MNRNEWAGKFDYPSILLSEMIKTMPNFEDHDEEYVIRKAMRNYARINTASIMVLKNRKMPYLRIDTSEFEDKIRLAKEILKIELRKKGIENKWEHLLPDIGMGFEW